MKSIFRKSLCGVLAVALLMPTPMAGMKPTFAADTMPDVAVPQFVPPALSADPPTKLLGDVKGAQTLLNASYYDVINNTFQKDIVKMSALGVIRKYGETSFRPKVAITGNEAIAMLVRARGRESAVMTRVSAGSAGLNNAALKVLQNTEYAREARTLNIVPIAEQVDLDKPVNREKLAVWSARALNLQPDYNDLKGVFSFKDGNDVSPQYRNLVESMVSNKLFNPANDGNFKPKATITRGEFARDLNLMSDRFMTNLAITADYGLVIGRKDTTEVQAGVTLTKTVFTVKAVDGKLTEITAQYNPKTKLKNEFVTFKGEQVGNSKQIAIGDEIAYFMKNSQVIYAEALSDDTIIEKIKETIDTTDGVVAHFGTVGPTTKQSSYVNGKYLDATKTRMKDFDGNVYEINVTTNPNTGVKNDVIVYKNGKAGGTSLLKEGDNVAYYVKDNKTVIYIKVVPASTQTVSGSIRILGPDDTLKVTKLSLYDYAERIVEYPVAQHALVTINGSYAELKDLQLGQEVKATIRNGYVVKIDAETFTENPGGIDEFGKIRMGEIYIIRNNNYITVDLNDGNKASYQLDENTMIIKDGGQVTFKALKEGDKVKLFFNDIYSNDVQKIEVEGGERLIKYVYKGIIRDVNPTAGTMTLDGAYIMKNTGWVATDSYSVDVAYTENTDIYSGNTKVQPRLFARNYLDKVAYVVVEDNYGTETAVKVNVRSGEEILAKDTVEKVNSTLSSLELANKENYLFSEGTIVIRDGRLIDTSRIKPYDSAFIISDRYMGKRTASVVKLVTGVESIFDRIYIGALATVDYSSVTFKNFANMTSNHWNSVDNGLSKRFYLSSDTKISNITNSPAVSVKPGDFFNAGYSEVDNRDSNGRGLKYEHYYGIIVTDGLDTINAMTLRKFGLVSGQNIDDYATDDDSTNTNDKTKVKAYLEDVLKQTSLVRGTVAAVDTGWTRIQLTNSNEWSSSLATWNANSVDTYVKYSDALIMKKDKVISVSDIKTGDTLYVLRYNGSAMVIFVESK